MRTEGCEGLITRYGLLNLTHTSTALRSRHSILATSGALDLASLCVIPGKQCWVLYVDVLVCRPPSLSAAPPSYIPNVVVAAVQVLDSGGSLVDTVTLAAYAALANARCRTHIPAVACCCVVFAHHTTHGLFSVHSFVRLRRLPKLHVVSVGTKDGGGEELDIEVDEDPNAAVAIDASGVPITVTFCQVQCRLTSRLAPQCTTQADLMTTTNPNLFATDWWSVSCGCSSH